MAGGVFFFMKQSILFLFFILILVMVGCQSATEKTEETNKNSLSITDFADRTVTFNEIPQNIVTLGNGETDIIYALGGEVVGRPTGDAIIAEAKDALEIGS